MYEVKTKLLKHDNKLEKRDTHSACLTVTLKHERLPVPSAVNGYNDAARFEGCPKAASRSGYCAVHLRVQRASMECMCHAHRDVHEDSRPADEEPLPKRVKLDA